MSTGVCVTGSVVDDRCGDTEEEGPGREATPAAFKSLFNNRAAAPKRGIRSEDGARCRGRA